MTVRLSHRQRPDTQHYIFQALGSPFTLTGIAASLRIAYRMLIPDKIPYILSGQSATVSKLPPVWGTLSAYSITEGVAVAAQNLPVTVPNGGSPFITVAWHSSSVPSTKPTWVTLTSGTTPTIAFTGAQLDANDVSSMVLSATANGQTTLSTGVAINVAASSVMWTQSTLGISIPTGSTASVDLSPYLTNYDPALHQLSVTSGTLPTGITVDSLNSELDASGTQTLDDNRTVTLSIIDTAAADWLARSTAPGVVFADPWETLPPVTSSSTRPVTAGTWRFTDAPSKLTLDTTVKPTGRAGSIRMNFLNVHGSQQDSQLRAYFGANKTFAPPDELWFSWRQYAPREYLWQPLPANPPGTTGHKRGIMSWWENSHTNGEIVPGDPQNENELTGYIDGVDYNMGDIGFSSPLNAADFRRQNVTDRGINRLLGNHPDTGSAFTNGDQWQVRARWGQTYGARSNPGSPEYRKGYGDPFSGALRVPPDEWVTFIVCTTLTSWSAVRHRVWMARNGQAPVKARDTTQAVHADAFYECFWPMTYVTNLADGGRKITGRTNNITGIRIDVCGLTTPIGQGTLSWNASTQRLTWAGFGESAGTAVGFSDANGILVRNVCGSGSSESYLIVEKTGALPGSNQTDTVTIADGRPDTATWYAEFIVSTLTINAPGGFVPT